MTYFGPVLPPSFYKAYVQGKYYTINTLINNGANKMPSKNIFTFKIKKTSNRLALYQERNLDFYKEICSGFECDESASDYYCFSKPLQFSDQTKSSILEIRFFK